MKTLYLECSMGAAGDMLAAALLELHPNPEKFIGELNAAGIPGVAVQVSRETKHGVTGIRFDVTVNGEREGEHDSHHAHSHMEDIESLVEKLNVSESVRRNVAEVYRLVAEAESHAHGVPVSHVHFHEVGAMDAVADITGVCMLIEALAPDKIVASPVHVGCGTVRCAHGLLPVPAPATARLLRGVPVYGGKVEGELCTPTGAALLRHFAKDFDGMPVMKVLKIGYGMGKKDFEAVNCVRAFLGEGADSSGDEVTELRCNLDDMTPESVAFVQRLLMEEGALDVCVVPALMKKGRMGVILECMCRRETADHMAELLFKHTSTLGLRETVSLRRTLYREQRVISTKYGPVSVKLAPDYQKAKPEYEDVARIARERGLPFDKVAREVMDGIE